MQLKSLLPLALGAVASAQTMNLTALLASQNSTLSTLNSKYIPIPLRSSIPLFRPRLTHRRSPRGLPIFSISPQQRHRHHNPRTKQQRLRHIPQLHGWQSSSVQHRPRGGTVDLPCPQWLILGVGFQNHSSIPSIAVDQHDVCECDWRPESRGAAQWFQR